MQFFFKVSGRHHGQDLQNNNVTAAAKAEFVVAAPAAAVVRGRGCAPRFVVVLLLFLNWVVDRSEMRSRSSQAKVWQ